MQVLAAGALSPKDAIEYLGKFPKIESGTNFLISLDFNFIEKL